MCQVQCSPCVYFLPVIPWYRVMNGPMQMAGQVTGTSLQLLHSSDGSGRQHTGDLVPPWLRLSDGIKPGLNNSIGPAALDNEKFVHTMFRHLHFQSINFFHIFPFSFYHTCNLAATPMAKHGTCVINSTVRPSNVFRSESCNLTTDFRNVQMSTPMAIIFCAFLMRCSTRDKTYLRSYLENVTFNRKVLEKFSSVVT